MQADSVQSQAQSLLLRAISRVWLVNTLIQIVLITNCVRNLSQLKATTLLCPCDSAGFEHDIVH